MQKEWNRKFSSSSFLYGREANNFIKNEYKIFRPKSSIICLGEGEGRNAIFLAKKGFKVEALDASDVALEKLKNWSKEESLDIVTINSIFESWAPIYKYDGAICIAYHTHINQREYFFKKVLEILNKDGIFLSEVFTTKQLKFKSGGPKSLDMLYDIIDTYNIIKNLPFKILKFSEEIVALDEGELHQGEASVLRMILQKI